VYIVARFAAVARAGESAPRSVVPPPAFTSPPWVSAACLVMMLMTPFMAFAPQMVAPGPRITSILSMSSNRTSWTSQYVPAKNGVNTVRPSINTKSLLLAESRLAMSLLKPREVIAH
jgi:hypothetical protein